MRAPRPSKASATESDIGTGVHSPAGARGELAVCSAAERATQPRDERVYEVYESPGEVELDAHRVARSTRGESRRADSDTCTRRHAVCGFVKTGIPHVIVNGTVVVRDSKVLKGVNPGQPIRFEPEKSRFRPLTVEGWTKAFYAAPIDFGGGVPDTEPDRD